MNLSTDAKRGDGLVWRCTKYKCNSKFTIRHLSIFEDSRIDIRILVRITYGLFLQKLTILQTYNEINSWNFIKNHISHVFVNNWLMKLRENFDLC